MKRTILYLASLTLFLNTAYTAEPILDVDFTRDSVIWKTVFPHLVLSDNLQEYSMLVDDIQSEGWVFNGTFGRFYAGAGTMAQPSYIEDFAKTRRYAFRLDNRENAYIELPTLENAGRFTVFCKNENGYANSELAFFIQQKVGTEWVNLRTIYVPPHHNQNFELEMEEFLQINSAVKLRLYGATRKLHVYQIRVDAYDASEPQEKPLKIILLPDAQSYVKQAKLNHVYVAQPDWLNAIADSVKFVLNLGDIVDENIPDQWSTAAGALNLLEGKKIPFTLTAGNHDMGTGAKFADTRSTNLMNNYLPLYRYERHDYFGGVFEAGKIDNTWHTFSKGDYKFLILSMEYAPRDKVLNWAKSMIEQHPNHNVIINTHSYLSDNNELRTGVSQLIGNHTGENHANDGLSMWNKLVKLYPNCLFVFNGHVMGDGTGYRVGIGDNGNKVYQFLSNYQAGVGGLTQDEKNGMLRIVDLYPEKKSFKITAYSPFWEGYLEKADHHYYYTGVEFIKDGDPEGEITEPDEMVSEDFSSSSWEAELFRLNPGFDNGIPINPNAINPLPYTTPATGGGGAYVNLNASDLYFGKYKLINGSIETLEAMPCAHGSKFNHNNNGVAVGFRMNAAETSGMMEFETIPDAGAITIHVRNGNEFMFTTLDLEKYENGSWVHLHTFDLLPHGAIRTSRDEVLSYLVNSEKPVKLRLRNSGSRFINLFRVSIGSYDEVSGLQHQHDFTRNFRVKDRTLETVHPTDISLYNGTGKLMLKSFVEDEIDLPESIGKGIFIVKSRIGNQKIWLR